MFPERSGSRSPRPAAVRASLPPVPPSPALVAVAGPSGAGKTHWIAAEIDRQRQHCPTAAIAYWTPGRASVDRAWVAAAFPDAAQWDDATLARQLSAAVADCPPPAGQPPDRAIAFLEFGFHLDLACSLPQLQALGARRVAILPPDRATEADARHDVSAWSTWADECIPGQTIPPEPPVPELVRLDLRGQVFDPASLDAAWQELVGGAYGAVLRAKGAFDLADGRAFHFDYCQGRETHYCELAVPRCWQGRPKRPSALEAVGSGLDRSSLYETLRASCLSDALLAFHQETLRQASSENFAEE